MIALVCGLHGQAGSVVCDCGCTCSRTTLRNWNIIRAHDWGCRYRRGTNPRRGVTWRSVCPMSEQQPEQGENVTIDKQVSDDEPLVLETAEQDADQ